jgi:RecA-family ATPase
LRVDNFIENIEKQHQEMQQQAQPQLSIFAKPLTLRDRGWLTKVPPKRKYLFNSQEAFGEEAGFLPEGKACMIVSPGGCGKTFLLTHCALAAATGTEWLHAKATRPVKVLFIAAEEDESELWIRFYKMAKSLGYMDNQESMNLALDNIIPMPTVGINQRLISDTGEPKEFYNNLKSAIERDHEIKLVILDPAARFMASETETKNSAATDWVNLIEGLTLVGGKPTLLVAHHTNKSAIRAVGNDKTPDFSQTMARGASAIIDGFRWVLGLQRSEAKDSLRSIFIKMLKSNYSKLGQILEFEQDYENSGTLKLKGIVDPNSEKEKKINASWNEAKQERERPYNSFNLHRETHDDD